MVTLNSTRPKEAVGLAGLEEARAELADRGAAELRNKPLVPRRMRPEAGEAET